MLNLYKHKYSTNDIMHVLIGLTYFDDADNEPMPLMISDLSWEEVIYNIKKWVRDIVNMS